MPSMDVYTQPYLEMNFRLLLVTPSLRVQKIFIKSM